MSNKDTKDLLSIRVARRKKAELAEKITALCEEFTEQTGFVVDEIQITYRVRAGGDTPTAQATVFTESL